MEGNVDQAALTLGARGLQKLQTAPDLQAGLQTSPPPPPGLLGLLLQSVGPRRDGACSGLSGPPTACVSAP